MQPDGSVDAMQVVKIFLALAVFGAFTAKIALDWVDGNRPFRGEPDGSDGGSIDAGPEHHYGGWWGGDDGGGHGDIGDSGGH